MPSRRRKVSELFLLQHFGVGQVLDIWLRKSLVPAESGFGNQTSHVLCTCGMEEQCSAFLKSFTISWFMLHSIWAIGQNITKYQWPTTLKPPCLRWWECLRFLQIRHFEMCRLEKIRGAAGKRANWQIISISNSPPLRRSETGWSKNWGGPTTEIIITIIIIELFQYFGNPAKFRV